MKARIVALACLLTISAHAQDAPLPKEVQTIIDEAKSDCGGPVKLRENFVTARDVNGDGKPDYIVDYDKFECADMVSFLCGSAGCLTQIFVSMPDDSYVKVWDENVRALRFAKVRNKSAMIVELHGSACGKAGYMRCSKTMLWNGKTFTAAR